MIEEGQERKCTPYIPATYGPSPVFGMEGMSRGPGGYPGHGPPGYGYGTPHAPYGQPPYGQHGPMHPVRHPYPGVSFCIYEKIKQTFSHKLSSNFRAKS